MATPKCYSELNICQKINVKAKIAHVRKNGQVHRDTKAGLMYSDIVVMDLFCINYESPVQVNKANGIYY